MRPPTNYNPSPNAELIKPPSEEDLIYPYRRVWSSLITETAILFGICIVIIFLPLVIQINQTLWQPINILLAALPIILWGLISWLGETFVLQPRKQLFPVLLLSAMVARTIGSPIVNDILEITQWVPQQEILDRIIIYSLTLGIIPEVLKYIVIRYIAWTHQLRHRYDVIAFCITSAIGYATVLNFEYVIGNNPPPDISAIRIFGTLALQIMGSMIVAYGIAEIRLSRPTPLLVVSMISVASLISGITYALRGNLSNTRLTLAVSTPRLIISLLLSTILLVGIGFIVSFLFRVTERQEQEAIQEL